MVRGGFVISGCVQGRIDDTLEWAKSGSLVWHLGCLFGHDLNHVWECVDAGKPREIRACLEGFAEKYG